VDGANGRAAHEVLGNRFAIPTAPTAQTDGLANGRCVTQSTRPPIRGRSSAIDKAHEAFVAAMRANDCSALVALVAEDAVFAPPNAPNASGKAAVRGWV